MDAIAERQVPPRIFAVNDDAVTIGKHAFVAVGGDIPHRDLVVLGDFMAVDLGVFGRGAAHMRERRLPANDLARGIGNKLRITLQLGALIGKFVEAVSERGHRIARRIITADNQKDEIAHEFAVIHVAHRIRMEHDRNQVVGGRLALF